MIFSRWRSNGGGYDYFDSPSVRPGLGNDLPIPKLRSSNSLGFVCSTDIGRDLPADASPIGSGELAVGMVAPMDKSGLTGLGDVMTSDTAKLALAVGLGIGLGVVICKAAK